MSSVPPPLPSYTVPSGLLIGGSPAQVAMRAQAVLPSFPSLTHTVSASSPSSSPPLSSTHSDQHITHVHLGSSLSQSGLPLPPPVSPNSSTPFASSDERYVSLSVVAAPDLVGSKAHKAAICALLEALQTTMFTKKKEALDAYQLFVQSHHPRFTRSDALLVMYGSPVTPNSTLSSFHSTAAFTRTDRGLLAASGQLSWKNHQLRASAAKALGVVALLLDVRHNSDAAVFHALIAECDYSVVRLMKLPKHLSAPSPSSSASGNLHAALRVIDIVKDIRPDLIHALLEEKDAAAAHSSHSRLAASSSSSSSGGTGGVRSAPPTLHINIQPNSAAGTPRSSQATDPAPPSPRSPTSPPPLPGSMHDTLDMQPQPTTPHSFTQHRFPPPLPIMTTSPPPPPPLPALHVVTPTTASACQSPHSTATSLSHWLSHQEASSYSIINNSGLAVAANTPTVALSNLTQPLSACSSPLASKKKHFSSLPAGLHRLHGPTPQSATVTVSSSGGLLGDDWKQRLRSHLSGFFAHRVSREELERTGVLKRSQVFGVSLSSLSEAEDADHSQHIPRLLRRCIDVLSEPAVINLHGLFRISGDSREISEMKVRLDVGESVDLQAASSHSVAGLLKMWLRELPEPLLTFDMYAPIIATGAPTLSQTSTSHGFAHGWTSIWH